MASTNTDQLVSQANEAAEKGDLQAAVDFLLQAEEISPQDSGIKSGLGACLLHLGHAQEAVEYFQQVTVLEPQSPDAFCNLGMALTTAQQFSASEEAFLKALNLQPDHLLTRKNLAVLYVKQNDRMGDGLQILVSMLKENPKDLESVLMLASFYLLGGMYDSAEKLCQYATSLDPENKTALDIQQRIMAAVNLSQAPAAAPEKPTEDQAQIARPEHAGKLLALKNLKNKQEPAQAQPSSPNQLTDQITFSNFSIDVNRIVSHDVCYIGGQEFAIGLRALPLLKAAEGRGDKVKFSDKVSPDDFRNFNTFVFARPHIDKETADAFSEAVSAGKRVIIDIDEDFHHLPKDHPGYAVLGMGSPNQIKVLEQMLKRADLVTASSNMLVENYQKYTQHIQYLPTIWDSALEWWNKPAPQHRTFNVGWCDYASEIPNLSLIRHDVSIFIKETENALLVIEGDLRAVEYFNSVLPEDKILFVPFLGYDDYPFMLAHFDVVLSPEKKLGHNLAKPDTRLMEAGARRLPWIASRIPSYEEWEVGGLFADKPGDWYSLLKRLYDDSSLRQQLGTEGRKKADQRLIQAKEIWLSIL